MMANDGDDDDGDDGKKYNSMPNKQKIIITAIEAITFTSNVCSHRKKKRRQNCTSDFGLSVPISIYFLGKNYVPGNVVAGIQ